MRRCSSFRTTGVIRDHIAPPCTLLRMIFYFFSKAFFRLFHFLSQISLSQTQQLDLVIVI